MSDSSLCWNLFKGSEETGQTGSSGLEGCCNSNKHSLQTWWAVKQLRKHYTMKLKVDELQTKTSGLTTISKEQESEAIMGTGLHVDTLNFSSEHDP